MKDKVSSTDHVQADLNEVVAPRSPCPKCGAETKEDHEPGWRVCSNRSCRTKVAPTTLN